MTLSCAACPTTVAVAAVAVPRTDTVGLAAVTVEVAAAAGAVAAADVDTVAFRPAIVALAAPAATVDDAVTVAGCACTEMAACSTPDGRMLAFGSHETSTEVGGPTSSSSASATQNWPVGLDRFSPMKRTSYPPSGIFVGLFHAPAGLDPSIVTSCRTQSSGGVPPMFPK
ncbi:MAG: hypothetical protein MUF33_00395 [Candidatus Nanopelagicales bacterium]|nr:hypothetical protein [Candidatus Nanopelagicales bacterium]